MASKRELIDTGKDKRYARRDEKGRFKEVVDVGKSLAADRRTKSKMVRPRELSQTAAFKITLPPQHASKLVNLAREAGVPPEEFLRAKVENWLARPEADFAEAAAYVVKKNAELYRRLA
jgi:hypothetical protein